MSRTDARPDDTTARGHYGSTTPTTVSGWAGWIAFATFMMVLVGTWHAISGLVALFRDDYFLVNSDGLVVTVDYTAWGWIHLIGGIVVAAAGVGLLTGRMVARVIAVLVALLSAVVNFAFLAAYPFWSLTMIIVDILVIWAVVVHGDELREA
ncbi:DUF7144 family membrane protein [Aeromicrobium massiliense]|uniref:DUF7144 family membrane protein n=1 Tax=Aeromicrobium massiliense TaxID=1464554 RepID=UPI0002E2DC36|nr:hypothetical protein [Aeromicrobium massiliense]